MIWHHHECIQHHAGEKSVGDGVPGVPETPPSPRRGDPGDRPGLGLAATTRANTRFAPTGGEWNGDGVCPDQNPFVVFPVGVGIGRDESRPYGTGSRCTLNSSFASSLTAASLFLSPPLSSPAAPGQRSRLDSLRVPLLVGVVEGDGEFRAVEVLPPQKAESVLDCHIDVPCRPSLGCGPRSLVTNCDSIH